jgi:hypothetical protein
VSSNELYAPLGPGQIRRLLAPLRPAEVEVVITARDLGRVIPSHWQTTLRVGSTTPWSDFSAAICADPSEGADVPGGATPHSGAKQVGAWFWRRHDIPAMIARWQRFVPTARMTVVTVPPPGSDSRTVGDRFAAAVGVDASGFREVAYAHTSLGAYSAELLRRLNERFPDLERHQVRWGIKDSLARTALGGRDQREPGFALTGKQLVWVRARADRMIDELASSGVRVVGDLSDLQPAGRVRADAVDPSGASDADLLEAALDGLGGMVRIVGDQYLDIERVRRAEPPGG